MMKHQSFAGIAYPFVDDASHHPVVGGAAATSFQSLERANNELTTECGVMTTTIPRSFALGGGFSGEMLVPERIMPKNDTNLVPLEPLLWRVYGSNMQMFPPKIRKHIICHETFVGAQWFQGIRVDSHPFDTDHLESIWRYDPKIEPGTALAAILRMGAVTQLRNGNPKERVMRSRSPIVTVRGGRWFLPAEEAIYAREWHDNTGIGAFCERLIQIFARLEISGQDPMRPYHVKKTLSLPSDLTIAGQARRIYDQLLGITNALTLYQGTVWEREVRAIILTPINLMGNTLECCARGLLVKFPDIDPGLSYGADEMGIVEESLLVCNGASI